jgi:hypothetical protein
VFFKKSKVEIIQQKGHNFLWIDDYLWMWDIPAERKCQKELADQAFGKVLVVGYGLGIIQKYLLMNHDVVGKFLLTIEKNKQVIEECCKVYGQIYGGIIIKDFFKYKTDEKFTCIIGDIWEDILPEGLENYKKFKKKAEELIAPSLDGREGKILAWGQDYFEYLIKKSKTKELT